MIQPLNQEAKSLVIRLRQRNYKNEEITEILKKLGFFVTQGIVGKTMTTHEEQKQIQGKRESSKNSITTLDSEKIKQLTYLFQKDQAMTVNKAAQFFNIGKQNIRKYMLQFGIGCIKGKGQKIERFTFKRYNRGRINGSDALQQEQDEQRMRMSKPQIKERTPINPLCQSKWKKVEIRIIFPKIRYGQVHQWERYYDRLTKEVQLRSLKFLDFKKGEKFTGKGCYIYILSEYDENVYVDKEDLEIFLVQSLPEDFFAGNCLNTNKIRVFEYPYISESATAENVIINLKEFSNNQIFQNINSKINQYNSQENQLLNDTATTIGMNLGTDINQTNHLFKKNHHSSLFKENNQQIKISSYDKQNMFPLNQISYQQIERNCVKSEYFSSRKQQQIH